MPTDRPFHHARTKPAYRSFFRVGVDGDLPGFAGVHGAPTDDRISIGRRPILRHADPTCDGARLGADNAAEIGGDVLIHAVEIQGRAKPVPRPRMAPGRRTRRKSAGRWPPRCPVPRPSRAPRCLGLHQTTSARSPPAWWCVGGNEVRNRVWSASMDTTFPGVKRRPWDA